MAIREANSLRNAADVLIAVAFGYFVTCFSLSQVGRYFEHRTTRDMRPATEPTRGVIARPLVSGRPETQAAP